MKNITNDIAEKFVAHFQSDEVKSIIEATEKAAESDTGTFRVVITTENLDRYQEVIKMEGWETDHYMNNPVVLWGHNHNTLIGVCTSLTIEDGKMVAEGRFAPTEEGQEKRKLYDQGFLKATSVGFIEKEREGNLITKAELLEFSFVSVPANPYALSLAMEKEISINELVTKGIFTLKEVKEEDDTAEAEEDTAPEETDSSKTEEENTEAELTEDEKRLVDAITKSVVTTLKETGALEVADEGEPEGTEGDEQEDEDVETEDVKAFTKKKILQKGVTAMSEVLAELREVDRR